MANLKYRIRSDAPIPGSTQVLTQGLTSEDIDGNFRSLDVAKVERVGEETITGSLTVDNIKTDLNTISSVNTNGNINIEPNGTGNLVVYTDTVELGGSSAAPSTAENVLVTTRNASDLTLNTNNGTSSGYITIFDAANSDITIEPNGTGNVNLVTDTVRLGSLNENSLITTQGTGDLTLNTNAGTDSGNITIFDGANANIELQVNGTGVVVVNEVGNAADVRIEGDTDVNLLFVDGSADRVAIGTNAPTNKFHIQQATAATDAVTNVFRIDSQSTGTPAVGIGVGMEFAVETAADNTEVGATIEAVATDVTAASEDFNLVFRTMIAGAAVAQVGKLNNNTLQIGATDVNTTLTTLGTADLTINTNSGTDSGSIIIPDGTNQSISIEPNGTGNLIVYTDTVEIGGNSASPTAAEDVILTTRNASDLTLSTNNGTNSATLKLFDGANNNIELQVNGTGVVVINEAGNAADFRVEGDADVNLLFADGSADRIGVGTSSPNAKLDVRGTVIINEDGGDNDVRIEGDADVNLFFTDASTDRVAIGTNEPTNKFHIQQSSATTNSVTDVLRLDSQSTGTPAVGIGVGVEFAVETAEGNTEVGATIEAVTTDVASGSEDFDIVFRTMIAGAAASQVGKLNNSTLQVGADATATTILTQGASNLTLKTGSTNTGSLLINQGDNGVISIQTHGTGEVVINDAGNASDVRIEGDADANLFFTDGSADRVAIGTNAPTNKLHVQQSTATTNAVTQVLRLDSQSTGTPANGIGVGMQFAVETAADNTEVGATIEAVATDVTATSEDFDIVFRTMIAGAAASQVGKLNNNTLQVGADATATTILTQGASNLTLKTGSTNTGTILINQGDNGNIEVTPHGTGDVYLTADTVRVGDANAAATIITNGTGNLTLKTGSTNTGDVTITQGDNGNITLNPHGTGLVSITKNLDVDGDVNIDGGDLTTNQTSFNVINVNASTVAAFGAATSIDIGSTTGTTSINHNLDVDLDVNIDGGDLTTNQTSFNIIDTNATTVNAFGAATTLTVGHDGASASTTNIATGATGNTLTKTINLGTAGAAGSTTNVNVGSANTRTVGALTIETKDIQFNGSGNIIFADSSTTKRGVIGTSGGSDQWFVGGGATAADGGFLEIATGDNGNAVGAAEPIHVRQYNGGNPLTGTLTRTATLLDANGNTSFPNTVSVNALATPGVLNGSVSLTTTSTTQTAIHSVAFADYDGGKYVIQAKRGADRQITEVLVTHDGSTAIATEYAVLMTGPRLFTVDVDINSTNMRVLITATAATSTTYRGSFSLLTA